MVAMEKTPTTGKKILLPLAKSNLIFSHSCNITLSASLPNFSFTYRAWGIIDTNLLYKASLNEKPHGWLCLTFPSLPSESIQLHEDLPFLVTTIPSKTQQHYMISVS